jgi:outer membrane protein assembly factor BamB
MFRDSKAGLVKRIVSQLHRAKCIRSQICSAGVLHFASSNDRRSFLRLVFLGIVFAFAGGPVFANDGDTWPGHRGEGRDGHVAKLPTQLSKVELLWRFPLPASGVGGVSATENFVVVSGRDRDDKEDVFICLDPVTGTELWRLQYESLQTLDYGNSPRATPLIDDPWVYLLGAGGQLHCVDMDSGEVKWKRHLVDDFQGERPQWGYGASPLLLSNRLILQPGGKDQALVAIDAKNGDLVWAATAEQTGYASPQAVKQGDLWQLVTLDRKSLRGWDAATGQSLWSVTPEGSTEFHVPMPLVSPQGVITVGEVRGTCRYPWNADGTLSSTKVSEQFELAPDMHSPVASAKYVYGVHDALLAVDIENAMEIKWRIEDKAFLDHCSLLIAGERLLVVNERSELLLIDLAETAGDQRILYRESLGDGSRSLAHPALVGDVLYVRTNGFLSAWSLVE